MEYFNSPEQALAYLRTEVLDALEEDLRRMQEEEQEHYTDDDRKQIQRIINDVANIMPLLTIKSHGERS